MAHAGDGSSNRNGSVMEHFDRAKENFSLISGLKEVWVVNFCTRRFDNEKRYNWPSSNTIRVAHIWHDLQWENATIVFDSDNNTPHVINL